jgi:hypothetical protein
MAEPIDYLKTYLNIDPMDYSAMEAQIAGEPLPEREVFTMPSYRPQVDLSQMQAMPMQPMAPTQPSGDSRLQSLMDEISALKSQIAELESAQATPVSDVPATRIVDELTKPKPDKTITPSPALSEGMTLFGQAITPDSFGGEPTRKGFAMATARPDLPPANVRGPFGFINNKQPSSGGSIGEAIRNLTLKFPKAQMQSVRLPNQVRADSSTTPYNVIQDQPLPSLPSRDVARNVLDTQMMYRPQQFAGGGSLDKALQNLKSQLSNG